MHRYTLSLFSALWLLLGLTVIAIIVPTLFSQLEFFAAGKMAMALFQKLGIVECIISTVVLGSSIKYLKYKNWWSKLIVLCSVSLFIEAFFARFYIMPNIIKYTMQMLSNQEYPYDPATLHGEFHNMYISVDSIKLILLLCLLSFAYLCERQIRKIPKKGENE